jgi:hypothetical protein
MEMIGVIRVIDQMVNGHTVDQGMTVTRDESEKIQLFGANPLTFQIDVKALAA